MKKIEIFILAGFLGSGKTTLLKRLLEYEKSVGRKVAVMMNELGSVSIDSDIVEDDISLKELLGGCVCCSIQDELDAQLQQLLLVEKPDVIYIETTGVAHPIEVLDAILSPIFAEKLDIKGIITTVDGLRWRDRKLLNPQLQQLLIEQVRFSDFIIINKMNDLTDAEHAKVTFEIQNINSKAPCILTSFSNISIEQLRNQIILIDHPLEGNINKGKLNIKTFVYQFHASISQSMFEDFLRNLPETIYRIKGYIKFDQSEHPYLFQFSYGMPFYMNEEMNMPLNMVFIGEEVNWKVIENQLQTIENEWK